MRYRKNAMIVAAQPESTEAGAEILKAGGNAVDAAMACALVQGVVDPLMCGIAGFGSCGIAMPAQGLPRLHRLPRACAARRPPRHVGRPDRVGGARRLRLHPARPRERHRLPVDLRAREPAGLPRRPPRARAPAVGADRRAGDRLGGGRLDGAAARGVLVGGRGTDGPRAEPRAAGVHAGRPRALLPPRRHAQARGRPRRESRPRPGAAPHRQAWRRRLLRGRDRPRHRRGHAPPRRPDRASRTSASGGRRGTRRSGAPTAATACRAIGRRAGASCCSRC